MSPSPASRTAQGSPSLKKSPKKRGACYRAESSDSDVVALEDSDCETEETPRQKPKIDWKITKSPKARRIILSSSSETESEVEVLGGHKLSTRGNSNGNTLESEISRNFLPSIERQAFLPVENIHYNWVFWRLYSEEIYSTYDKHLVKFDGEYLSRYLLGEIFHEKVNDEEADFDPSIFFQAVQIKCVHKPFEVGNGHKRLSVDCEEISTSTNSYMEDHMKRREIIAQESLVDLLISCLEVGDLLFVFGDIQVEEWPFINLNSRYQHPILMAHYRHDGNFGPVLPANKDFQDIMQPCLSGCFSHTVHEYDDNEYAIKVVPNVSAGEHDIGRRDRSPSLTAALRSPRRLTPKKSEVSEAVSILEPSVLDLQQGTNKKASPFHKFVNQISDSDESSSLGIDIVNEIEENRVLDSPGITTPSIHMTKVTHRTPEEPKATKTSVQHTERERKHLTPVSLEYGLKECSVRLEKLPRVL